MAAGFSPRRQLIDKPDTPDRGLQPAAPDGIRRQSQVYLVEITLTIFWHEV
jgi:hypothetical protein